MFTCGSLRQPAGSEIQSKSNMKKAQQLVKASGYEARRSVDEADDLTT